MRRAGLFCTPLGHPTTRMTVKETTRQFPAAKVVAAKRATAKKAAARQGRHDGARVPPPAVRLLGKDEVCAIAGVTPQSIWNWQRAGKFPRGRVVGGQTRWLSTEVEAWLAELPVRRLKGDAA